ncbi:hypothetical protein BDK51DRAFT_42356 [Blyttiomyces helicus]|uniref:Uncharacterized protein n=1 Tax=Blyttiomyces helicus TaxID=388810 RepID=A0A4P9WP88_9FUNG|nr:hypothetical protein BDK51DRAFT_42356 [Blyttiomyces helicus]|eukprot:RKO94125.1 hypothetical protein BDK51DRAFT_42356 [Blyttiomyces helicus]
MFILTLPSLIPLNSLFDKNPDAWPSSTPAPASRGQTSMSPSQLLLGGNGSGQFQIPDLSSVRRTRTSFEVSIKGSPFTPHPTNSFIADLAALSSPSALTSLVSAPAPSAASPSIASAAEPAQFIRNIISSPAVNLSRSSLRNNVAPESENVRGAGVDRLAASRGSIDAASPTMDERDAENEMEVDDSMSGSPLSHGFENDSAPLAYIDRSPRTAADATMDSSFSSSENDEDNPLRADDMELTTCLGGLIPSVVTGLPQHSAENEEGASAQALGPVEPLGAGRAADVDDTINGFFQVSEKKELRRATVVVPLQLTVATARLAPASQSAVAVPALAKAALMPMPPISSQPRASPNVPASVPSPRLNLTAVDRRRSVGPPTMLRDNDSIARFFYDTKNPQQASMPHPPTALSDDSSEDEGEAHSIIDSTAEIMEITRCYGGIMREPPTPTTDSLPAGTFYDACEYWCMEMGFLGACQQAEVFAPSNLI